MRFTKENRTFHLQIKQAKLLPMGIIDNTSMSWASLPQFSLNNWLDKSKYHKLSYESRSFDLDELIAPKNYIITGKRNRTSVFDMFVFDTGINELHRRWLFFQAFECVPSVHI